MTKAATIASLVRVAAKTEVEFVQTIEQVMEEADAERAAEFFDRMNIPRSVGLDEGSTPTSPIATIRTRSETVQTFQEEREIATGIQKFLDRHERKLKWHVAHPAVDGMENALLLFRCNIAITELRLERVMILLKSKDELNPIEWAIARELMNRAYLSFRNYLNILAGEWIDALQSSLPREEIANALGNFYEIVDGSVRKLEQARERLEERRQQLTVLPGDPFPPVKPPNYFGGDLLGRGPWKQFWSIVVARSHHFREAVG